LLCSALVDVFTDLVCFKVVCLLGLVGYTMHKLCYLNWCWNLPCLISLDCIISW
jgi:hypothetical protein